MTPARVAVVLGVLAVGLIAMGQAAAQPIQWASWNPWAPDAGGEGEAPQDTTPGGIFEDFTRWADHLQSELLPMPTVLYTAEANRRAFLSMIAEAEGTERAGGYACLYGSTPSRKRTFSSFADHPRIAQRISATDSRWTSAAGRYQFMAVSPIPTGGSTRVDTWDRIKRRLSLPDFGPQSQDLAALELIREAGALADVDAGRVIEAARKCRGIWASLPGAGYNQPERGEQFVTAQYLKAGGTLA